MIQPVSALISPRATYKGGKKTYNATPEYDSRSRIALLNASGVSLAAGGLTAAIARAYTNSWSHSIVLGLFGSFLTMFFMTPQIIEKMGFKKNSTKAKVAQVAKTEQPKARNISKEILIPVKKLVQFKSDTVNS